MARALGTTILSFMLALPPRAAVAQADPQRAQEFFKEAQALCERDGGRLQTPGSCPHRALHPNVKEGPP